MTSSFSGKNPSTSDVSKLLHLPQALQRNIHKFTENILFNSTDIPDELIASECLSEDECSTISLKSSNKDQTRLLIRKIKTRGPQVIEKFLEIVGKHHPSLPVDVKNSLDVILNEHMHKPVCVICVMQSTVDLKDVGDSLWGANIISDDIYDLISDCEGIHRSRQIIWDSIINSINHYEDPSKALDVLHSALETKYKHIVDYLRENPDKPELSCSCCRRRARSRPVASDFGSQTDVSTTSEIATRRIPKTIYRDYRYDDSHSITSSQDQFSSSNRGMSFELLDRFDSIGSESDKVFSQNDEVQIPIVSSTTMNADCEDDDHKECSRHSSGKFVPQENLQGVADMDDYDRNSSIPCTQSAESDSGQKHVLMHSISTYSNATVCAATSTGSGVTDGTHSTEDNPNKGSTESTDAGLTPEIRASIQFPQDVGIESAKETDIDGQLSKDIYTRQRAYRRRRLKSSINSDDEEDIQSSSKYIENSRLRRYQRKRFARQRSVPHGEITLITPPRYGPDTTPSNVGVRKQESRKSKQSKKRELRRLRSQGKYENATDCTTPVMSETEEKGLKKPFNPLWGKNFVQPKLLPKWDHNQARRYRQMAQLHAFSVSGARVMSDTDIKTDEFSDTLEFSDFTT